MTIVIDSRGKGSKQRRFAQWTKKPRGKSTTRPSICGQRSLVPVSALTTLAGWLAGWTLTWKRPLKSGRGDDD